MFKSLSIIVLVSLASFGFAAATPPIKGFEPTEPGPGKTFRAGSNCSFSWNEDMTGKWQNVTVALMSGSNSIMVELIPVLKNMDGTKKGLSPFNWTCPAVDTYSASYFYRFWNNDDVMNATYTTRFTIASPSGNTTTPQFATQPDGSKIPWSNGHFVSASALMN